MKQMLMGLVIVVATWFTASQAAAFSIALDIPLSYQLDKGGSADSVNGYKLGLGLVPFSILDVGLGYENYRITQEDGGADLTGKFSIFDVFLDVPFPFINIVAGVGVGKLDVDYLALSESASVRQTFVSLGFPFALLFDVHVGWHAVNVDKVDLFGRGGDSKRDLSGTMWSLGAKVGF